MRYHDDSISPVARAIRAAAAERERWRRAHRRAQVRCVLAAVATKGRAPRHLRQRRDVVWDVYVHAIGMHRGLMQAVAVARENEVRYRYPSDERGMR